MPDFVVHRKKDTSDTLAPGRELYHRVSCFLTYFRRGKYIVPCRFRADNQE